jgi:hypothetical protein
VSRATNVLFVAQKLSDRGTLRSACTAEVRHTATMMTGILHFGALLLAGWLGATFLSDIAAAETLREVRASKEMQQVVKDTNKGRTSKKRDDYWLSGMEQGSNFASIWMTGKSPELLLSWLSVNIPKYSTGTSLARRAKEFAIAQTTISNTSHARVALTVLVPHPTYRTMVEYKTLTEFTKYEPPALAAAYQEEIPLNGTTGMLYQTAKNQCSVLVKVAQLGLVNLEVRNCRDKGLLVAVAKALDFPRLNRKLNS